VSLARYRPTTATSGRRPGRVVAALLVSGLLTATAVVVGPAPRAGADPVTSLRQRAAVLSQQLVLEQLQVGAAQQQVSVASARVTQDAASIARLGAQLAADRHQVASATASARAQALDDYMGAGTASAEAVALLLAGGSQARQDFAEYQSIAVGNIAVSLDRLHTAEAQLTAQQAALRHAQADDQAALDARTSALSQATALTSALAAAQAQVTGQLAAAVAQQAAAQQAAAQAALRAAWSATHTSASTRALPATPTVQAGTAPPGPPSGNLPDPALNPYLQCVVRVESGGNYGAVSPNGLYMGAFQFSQPTWNAAALAAGLPGLVGVPPNTASKAAQDTLAVTLYALDGQQPWVDGCRT
jgi:hypothetical protein